MEYWQYAALSAAFCLPVLWIWNAIRKARLRKDRDFTRRLETVLHPKETVKVICPEKTGRWVLTNERLLLEQGELFFAIPFRKIKKVSGVDGNGKSTVAATKMAVLTVKADEEYCLHRRSSDFPDMVKGIRAGCNRCKPRKKKPKKADK